MLQRWRQYLYGQFFYSALATRFAVSRSFRVEEVLAPQLMTAEIVTIPIMIKLGVVSRGNGLLGTLMLTLGGSAIFPYVIAEGLYYASVSDAGALAPGTSPFWAAPFGLFNSWRATK